MFLWKSGLYHASHGISMLITAGAVVVSTVVVLGDGRSAIREIQFWRNFEAGHGHNNGDNNGDNDNDNGDSDSDSDSDSDINNSDHVKGDAIGLLLSRTHPEDPANASECAICLESMDGISLRTTVHPDTGLVHVNFGGLFLWYSSIDKMQGAHATDEIVPANAYDIEGASLEEVQVSPGPRGPHGHLRGLAWITSKVMP